MTEIEHKALALLNEVARERGSTHDSELLDRGFVEGEALCRAIEQHEAFRQEVSDAVEDLLSGPVFRKAAHDRLDRFIIAKPDPMDLVADDMMLGAYNPRREWGAELRAAIEKRGGKIVWGEG